MFCSKSFRITVVMAVLVFSLLATAIPSFADTRVIQRLPVMYKYNEDADMNMAVSLLTGGSNKWLAECVVRVCTQSNGSYFPLLVFTTPDRSRELGEFIVSLNYVNSLFAVETGMIKGNSGKDNMGVGISISYKNWKEDNMLWSHVVFENRGADYYNECEFGCTQDTCNKLLSSLDNDTLGAIAATM